MPRLRRDAIARMNAGGAAATDYWDGTLDWSPTTAGGGAPLWAPSDAKFIVWGLDPDLPNQAELQVGSGLSLTIGGGGPNTALVELTGGVAPRTIGLTIDGGGSAITTGEKGFVTVPFSGTITGWTLLADQVGSIVIDVWSDAYGSFPPTVADTIAGSEKPTLSGAQAAQDNSLTTWDTAVTAGDVIAFNVESASTVTRITLTLTVTPS